MGGREVPKLLRPERRKNMNGGFMERGGKKSAGQEGRHR